MISLNPSALHDVSDALIVYNLRDVGCRCRVHVITAHSHLAPACSDVSAMRVSAAVKDIQTADTYFGQVVVIVVKCNKTARALLRYNFVFIFLYTLLLCGASLHSLRKLKSLL